MSVVNKLKSMFTGAPKTEKGYIQTAAATSANQITPTLRNYMALQKAYEETPWLHAVINKIALNVAMIDMYIVTKSTGTKKPNHVALENLHNGNPVLTELQMRTLIQIYIELFGVCYMVKERRSSTKVEMWPVNPVDVLQEPSPMKEGGFYSIRLSNAVYDIARKDVVKIHVPSISSPYEKFNAISAVLMDEIDTDDYAAKHTRGYFVNSARPDIVVSADGLNRTDTERLEVQWNNNLKGFLNSYKVHFLNKAMKIDKLDTSFKDMDLVNLRKFERDTITQVFGVPPELFGILTNSNRATIDVAEYIFLKHIILPRVIQYKQSLEKFYLAVDYPVDNIALQFDDFVIEDRQFILNVMKEFPTSFSVEEIRILAGRPEKPVAGHTMNTVVTNQRGGITTNEDKDSNSGK